MAIPILETWKRYFIENPDEGLGSSYERIIINKKLHQLKHKFNISNCLEVPSFGFTGISGINSMYLALQNTPVMLIDDNRERIELIKKMWKDLELPVEINYQESFDTLSLPDRSFDLAWNYASLWFINDLESYLSELDRIVNKVIMLCVPNRTGLGYLSQKYISGVKLRDQLKEDNIKPPVFSGILEKLGWKLSEFDYFDCPPWPDIGMGKEELMSKIGLGFMINKSAQKPPINILNYYRGVDQDFETEILKFMWFEKLVPNFIKFFWAHHKYYIFTK